ncbi:RTA1-domain-containing protein [Stipitochalara longipes BDJ]|nr:RTA1-domain-containing protein [Stipitochalara longipes BDJ]
MSPYNTASLLVRDHPYNYTVNSSQECTLSTCSILQAQYTYDPSLSGNAFLASFFGLLLFFQLILGVYYRTIGFTIAMSCGLLLEVIGYIGRVQMHFNPFIQQPFMMELICVTIGPVFLTAAIYLCLSRIIVVYGSHLSRLAPGTIAISFMVSDFISLLLQAGGGAVVEIANDVQVERIGIHITIAGLSLQVASLGLLLVGCMDFVRSCRRTKGEGLSMVETHERIRGRRLFRVFLGGLLFATLAILPRSIYRIFELQGGFHGKLWNSEVDFMVCDGTMVALASLSLTFWHPGMAFHGYWDSANFKLRNKGCCGRGV